MSARRVAALALSFTALLGACRSGDCESPECLGTTDASVLDATPADAAAADALALDAEPPPDSGPGDAGPDPDAGQRFVTSSCLPCDTGCPGGTCLTNSTTRETFCADECTSDPTACPNGFICLDLDADPAVTRAYCLPPSSSCRLAGTGFGGACYGDPTTCLGLTHWCEGDVRALGWCTEACALDDDCPPGWRCAPGDDGQTVCHPHFAADAERCTRDDRDGERACAIDDDCADLEGTRCVRSEPTLPGVCAAGCAEASCAEGTSCLTTLRGPACLTDTCACHGSTVPAGTRDLLAEALAQADLSRCGTTFGVFDWTLVPPDVLADPYRLSFYDAIHNQPLRAPGWGREVVRSFDDAAALDQPVTARAARMVESLAALADRPAIAHAPGQLDPVEPLASAVAALIRTAGGTPDEAALRADADALSMELQLALAEVIDAMSRAVSARRAALGSASGSLAQLYDYGPAFVVRRADGRGMAPANAGNRRIFNETFQYGEMYGAAIDVLDAIAAADLGRFREVATTTTATTAHLLFVADTPVGRIAVGGAESGLYDARAPGFDGAWALLLDLGGDDEYRVPVAGNVTRDNAVSVMIDLGGDDRYGYVEVPDPLDGARLPSDGGGRYHPTLDPTQDNGPVSLSEVPRQGGARVGTAVLVDLGAGRDRYQSLRLSQGAGVFGAGVLVDDGGDDTYLAEAMAQGAGAFGIGLLYDVGGSDEHRAYQFAQGFAFARGAGLAYDAGGDDRWLMDVGDPAFGGDPLYFSAQRPGAANSTLGQGFAFGRRADSTDRAFMSGGLGVLVDTTGNDRYEGSIFAQGGGYWFGTGILADEAGDDHYDALWYAMGTGAHYALGLLLEGAGDDTYGGTFPRVNVTIAGGHDYSAAFLIDESGDDVYSGSRITVGAGNATGMGFFVDNAGNDTYRSNGDYAFGAAGLLGSDVDFLGSPRREVDVVGVFLDAGGLDTYEQGGMSVPGFGDDRTWTQTQNPDPVVQRIEKGTGLDGTGETTLHARWP